MQRISPNYKDRNDKNNRWAIRDPEVPDSYKPVKALVAERGEFFQTSYKELENGFGCGVVALVKDVHVHDNVVPESGAVKLFFDLDHFYTIGENRQRVARFKKLFLCANGTIYATL